MYASDLRHTAPALAEKLAHLYALNRNRKVDLGFRAPYLALLEAFGDPHLSLPPVIHVAGTNGKGSVVAMMRAILEDAGYRVHAYTSPHLVEFNERIVLAGAQIDNLALEALIDEATQLNAGRDVTFFEITTAMALAAFARTPADIVLLETGLGGRLDCTNVVPQPLACVITTIGMDHMEHLGETIEEIAAEKAGIIKPGVPCITGSQNDEAQKPRIEDIFIKTSATNGSPLFRYGADWRIEDHKNQKRVTFEGHSISFDPPALPGAHQIQNAGTAIACLLTLQERFPTTQEAIQAGLKNTRWPARLQDISGGALGALLPAQWSLHLDGGHNAQAGQAIAAHLSAQKAKDQAPNHVVMAMMNHKDPTSFVAEIAGHIDSLTLVDIPGEPMSLRAADMLAPLQDKFPQLPIATSPSPEDALRRLRQIAQNKGDEDPAHVLIAGSLYLAGYILRRDQEKAGQKP